MQTPERCAQVSFHIKSKGDKPTSQTKLWKGEGGVGKGEKMRTGSLQMHMLVIKKSLEGTEEQNTELLGDKEWIN